MGKKKHYRADIDGLRAVAVAMVIANHIDAHLAPGGYLGVDLFFVISGFVVTGSIVGRDDPRPWGPQLLDFYARRIRRLFPSLVLCVAVTMLAVSLFLPEPDELLPVGVAALFGGGNIYLYLDASNYFGQAAHDIPFTHTWSLGVEEQFYLLFPLMLLIGARWLGRRRWWLIAGFSLLSAIGYLVVVPVDRMAAFYLMPLRFWELGAGALLYFFDRASPPTERSPGWALLGLAAVVGATMHPDGLGPWPVVGTVVGTALVVRGRGGWGFGKVVSHPIAVAIGQRSYALYLWHWPAVVLVHRTLEITPLTALLALAITFGATELSYRFVEVPLRHADWGSAGPTLLKGLGASSTAAAVGYALASLPLFLGDPLPDVWWSHGPETCWAGRYTPEEYDHCLTPKDDDGPPRVFLVGDSHARMYRPALERALPDTEIHSLAIAFGCSLMPEQLVPPNIEAETACSDFNEGVARLLADHTRPQDVVIVGSYHRYVTGADAVAPQAAHLAALADAVAPTPVILVGDAPGLPEGKSGLGCQSHPWNRHRNDLCKASAEEVNARKAHHDAALRAAVAQAPNAHLFELDELLCEGGVCSAYLGDTLLYVDGDHLSIEGSEMLAEPFRDYLLSKGFTTGSTAPVADG